MSYIDCKCTECKTAPSQAMTVTGLQQESLTIRKKLTRKSRHMINAFTGQPYANVTLKLLPEIV